MLILAHFVSLCALCALHVHTVHTVCTPWVGRGRGGKKRGVKKCSWIPNQCPAHGSCEYSRLVFRFIGKICHLLKRKEVKGTCARKAHLMVGKYPPLIHLSLLCFYSMVMSVIQSSNLPQMFGSWKVLSPARRRRLVSIYSQFLCFLMFALATKLYVTELSDPGYIEYGAGDVDGQNSTGCSVKSPATISTMQVLYHVLFARTVISTKPSN